jgi:hypothetical protein
MSGEKMITVPEDTYARLLGQAAFLRAAIYALGGKYEVSFDTLTKHGPGQFELRGDAERKTVTCTLVESKA